VPLPIDRALTARLLGFSAPVHNVATPATRAARCESIILAACSQVMLTLSRLAQDLMLFTMPEFGYFVLPRRVLHGQQHHAAEVQSRRAGADPLQGRAVLGLAQRPW
jgi:argininosuccinate lyase